MILKIATTIMMLAAGAGEEVRLGRAREYPHAGVSVSLPVGFSAQSISGDFEIVRADRIRGRTATQSVTLSAFPIKKEVTAEAFSKMLLENLRRNLAMRYLKDLGQKTGKIAGAESLVRELTYKHRGDEIAAMGGVFVRTSETAGRVAYVLTIEVGKEHHATLDALFEAVAGSVKFMDIKRPLDLEIEKGSVFLKDFKARCALRLPKGWTGRSNQLGLFAGLTDYTQGGIYSPAVQVISLEMEKATPEQLGERALEKERKQGSQVKVLEKGPVKIAGKDGFQFVLQRKQPVPESAPEDYKPPPVIEIRRLFNIESTEEGKQKHFAILLTVHNCPPSKALEIMDKVAKGFSLLPSLGRK